eukprot:TRINITY_DN17017_c0_g1_i2.p1 TRINITY_DN17017_c0_g1~~TRINITY_DN17017_c0_g1_i2.p1  ORF type:complete len:261 (-),score=29.16 TRINITY_DN17017_c0_g1_i2:16-732(-)
MAAGRMRINVLTLSGDTAAVIDVDPNETCKDLSRKIAVATGHDRFSLVCGKETLPSEGTLADAGLQDEASVYLSVRDAGILRISGIPEDATFGGHGPAWGCEGKLSELNGDWEPVPLLEINRHPVWKKNTNLRNVVGNTPIVDDGMRYVMLGGDRGLDIRCLQPGEPLEEANFRDQSKRHGFICNFRESFIDLLDDGWPRQSAVFLALKSSESFPDVVPYSHRLGRNTHAGSAELIKA